MSEHLYIHVPFCLKKCRYCDFYSQTDLSRVPDFVGALVEEIRLRARPGGSRDRGEVKTLYFGGGTPSVLPAKALGRIMETLYLHYSLSTDAEITLEANPGTLDRDYLKALGQLGVNRLSLGVQSFDDHRLNLLGRIHTGKDAAKAVEWARAAGFDNLGMDLIYGLPGETQRCWQGEMEMAVSLAPEHLSCYMLTLEPGTPLYLACEKGRFIPMAGPAQVDRFGFTSTYLEGAGFCHYEISNFARGQNNISQHNSAYWKMVPYTGLGPSAHSYGAEPLETGETAYVRSWNVSDLSAYQSLVSRNSLPLGDQEYLTADQQMLERILVGLRTSEGIDIPGFDLLPGAGFQRDFKPLTRQLVSEGLGRSSPSASAFILTRAGWARLDSIVEAFARNLTGEAC